eukprot:8070278-Lingulodinium_polyedra.AAC.1
MFVTTGGQWLSIDGDAGNDCHGDRGGNGKGENYCAGACPDANAHANSNAQRRCRCWHPTPLLMLVM